MVEGDGTGGPGLTHVFNNTSDSPCSFRSLRGSSTGVYQNNHLIGFSGFSGSGGFANMTTNTDNGNEVLQTESAANAQGYVNGNDYAPTLISNATVGGGANLTFLCNGMDNYLAWAACQLGI